MSRCSLSEQQVRTCLVAMIHEGTGTYRNAMEGRGTYRNAMGRGGYRNAMGERADTGIQRKGGWYRNADIRKTQWQSVKRWSFSVNILTLSRSSMTSRFWFRASWFLANLSGWTSWNFGLIFLHVIKPFIMVLFGQVEFHPGKLKIWLLVRMGKLSSDLKLYTAFRVISIENTS